MKVRYCLFALVGLVLSTVPASAQTKFVVSVTDPSTIHACPGNPPADDATVWHADRVGVDRLIPSMPGSDTFAVSKYFRGWQQGDIVNDEQKLVLTMAKHALQRSVYKLFFAPNSQSENGRRVEITDEVDDQFYDRVIEATLPDNLIAEVWPCWTKFIGLTYGTKIKTVDGQDKFVVYAIEGPVYLGWYQDGAWTADHQPGARVTRSRAVIPEKGAFANQPVQLAVFDVCGNVGGMPALVETTNVVAPLPPEEPAPKPELTKLPENTPPLEQPSTDEHEVVASSKRHAPCLGPKSRWVCLGAAAAAGILFWPSGGTNAVTTANNNTPVKKF